MSRLLLVQSLPGVSEATSKASAPATVFTLRWRETMLLLYFSRMYSPNTENCLVAA